MNMADNTGRQVGVGPLQCQAEQHRQATPWERGQTMVVAAAVLVGLVVFLALIIDLGNVYAQRRAMQNAADAGALAGARALALSQSAADVEAKVKEYAHDRNRAQDFTVTILTKTVAVSVSEVVRTFFAPLIGVPSVRVGAIAKARYGPPASMPKLLPLLLDVRCVSDSLKYAAEHNGDMPIVQIWDSNTVPSNPTLGRISQSQRGWANFNGHEVDDFELTSWVANGYDEYVVAPTWINGTPGIKSKSLQKLAQIWPDKVILVPVFDVYVTKTMTDASLLGNGSVDYHICGFAAFHVETVVDTNSPKYVAGYFQNYVVPVWGKPGDGPDLGVRVVGLIQ